jgi:hypothetical protein
MPSSEDTLLEFTFEATVIYWRGPSPFFFAPLPALKATRIREILRIVTYGWGMVPVEARIGEASFTTSLFPKDETYLLPIKAAVRRRADITAGDAIRIHLIIRPPGR